MCFTEEVRPRRVSISVTAGGADVQNLCLGTSRPHMFRCLRSWVEVAAASVDDCLVLSIRPKMRRPASSRTQGAPVYTENVESA